MITTDQDTGGPFRSIAFNSVGWFGQAIYRVQSYLSLRENNNLLRGENAKLAHDNMQLQDALLENLRLRKLLGFREQSKLNLTAAEIIGENPHNIVNSLLLNAGKDRGIQKSAAVLTADGLVGKIISAEADRSICQILFDPNSRVSAIIQRIREKGIVSWDGGNLLKMMYIAKTIKVHTGDVVVTSGMSRIFPENIKVGVVIEISTENEGMFQEILVQPSVNFNRLEEVQVQVSGAVDGS
jgi:rod shape-determining protein MreC